MNRTHTVVWNASRQMWVAAHERATGRTKSSQSCSAVLTGVLLAGLTGSALAANYTASNEATLRAAIVSANADGDTSSTITLTNNIVVTSATAFATVTKPLTIDSGTFSLRGGPGTGTTGGGISLTIPGGALTLAGTVGGSVSGAPNNTSAGGVGLVKSGGTLWVAGSLNGGTGGGTTRTGSAGHDSSGAGGVGASLTSVALNNQGTITGGNGGTYNVEGGTGAGAQEGNTGVGGVGVSMSGAGSSLTNTGVIRGGTGGNAINFAPPGDNLFAGAGGRGAFLSGGTHTNSGTIEGGVGGVGYNVGSSAGTGNGGLGLALSSGAVMVNVGTIAGGNGLPGGNNGLAGNTAGAGAVVNGSTLQNTGTVKGGTGGSPQLARGGVGILGTGNATVINSGTVTAGKGPRMTENAITFSNTNNVLELRAGSTITGNVVGGSTDKLALGGATDASFNAGLIGPAAQYQTFGSYEKRGASTWTLTGATTAVTPWNLAGGTLSVSADGNLGATSGALTINGGTLQVTGTAYTTTTRGITLGVLGGAIDIANAANTFTAGQALTGGGALTKLGTGTLVMTGSNTYTGGTTISAGTLQLGNGGSTGSLAGNIVDNAALVFNRSNALGIGGVVSGTGAVSQIGTGTTTVTGTNTYTGGTTITAGALQLGNGGTTGSIVGNVTNAGTLVFNRSDALDFAGAISGNGIVNQVGAGNTNLAGNSGNFGGTTNVTSGTLRVNGTLGNAASTVTVSNGATLGGAGTIGGNLTIGNGVLSPGNSPGTLTINGNLALGAASQLNYELGAANTVGGPLNDLTVVNGNLTLDGSLNVTQSAGGTYGAGIYRLINYTGTLTDNVLALGNMPAGTVNYVQSSVANQVNLINSQGLTLNFWDGDAGGKNDGVVAGGNGTWLADPAGTDRWTQADGTINAPYQNPSFAVFTGTPGTVTVDNSLGQVAVSGVQFAASGYRIQGGNVDLTAGTNAIRVGDGTSAGASTTATIASALTGAGRLDKVDAGTLVLSGANTYSGGTQISAGTLQLGEGGTTGSIVGDVTNNGTLALARSDANTFSGVISGSGAVTQMGTGNTTLSGVNTYSGGTTIGGGTLTGSATSFGAGTITDNAALVIDQASDATLANAINGSGTFVKTGAGALQLTGNSALTGATTVAQGTLAVNGSLASSAVTVGNGATLAGSGTVGATALLAGSSITPGNNSIGTLNVNGNFTQAAGAIYQVQVDPSTTSGSDRISVTGAATIANGAILNVTRTGASPYSLNSQYTVLSAAGGVAGTYKLTGDTRTAFVQLGDTYDANNVYLTASQVRSFTEAGVMPNQIATAGALDTLGASSALRDDVAFLPNDVAARAAFDQLSGEQHASVQTALMEDSRFVREAANDRLLGAFARQALRRGR